MAALDISGVPGSLQVKLRTRGRVPAYTLRGYKLRAIVFGDGEIPIERLEAPLPDLAPGAQTTLPITFREKAPARIQLDVLRPTGSRLTGTFGKRRTRCEESRYP